MRPDDRARATLSASETASAGRAPRCLSLGGPVRVGDDVRGMLLLLRDDLRRAVRLASHFPDDALHDPLPPPAVRVDDDVGIARVERVALVSRARAASSSKTPRSPTPRPPTCPTASIREPRDDPSSCAIASVPRSPSARRGEGRSAPWDEKTLKATRNAARKASAGTRRPAIVSSAVGAPRRVVTRARLSRDVSRRFSARRRSTRSSGRKCP